MTPSACSAYAPLIARRLLEGAADDFPRLSLTACKLLICGKGAGCSLPDLPRKAQWYIQFSVCFSVNVL
jgi:hypothetical protein